MKLRQDLDSDPRYRFMVGRLVGAAEMVAALLQAGKAEPTDLAHLGKRLEASANWFLDPRPELPANRED